MPLLKDLNCSIELSDDQDPLQELGTVYGDAFVETFVPVPRQQHTFTIHLSSKNFIAPGIAMYVFIDGVYQCNRNRQNMKLGRPPDRRSLVDFKVRQKEERQKDGSMIAREWTFEKLDHVSADGAPDSCSPHILDNIGCIEVVVLRCAGTRNAKSAANMNMDGTADYPDYRCGRHGRSRTIAYDDRDPFVDGGPAPLRSATPYRSPYAETVRSREHSQRAASRYSEPVSPGTRPHRDIPAPGFQYGSGPLPPPARAASYRELMGEAGPEGASRLAPTVDPEMLKKMVANAVKHGVEESRKREKSQGLTRANDQRHEEAIESSNQVPGAWPTSPRHLSQHPSHRRGLSRHRYYDHGLDGYDSTLERLSKAKTRRSSRSRAGTRVAWDQESGWDKQSRTDDWGSPNDRERSWRPDETLSGNHSDSWKDARRSSKSRPRSTRNASPSRKPSRRTERISKYRRSPHGRSRKSQSSSHSRWKDDAISSSESQDDWSIVDAPSHSSTSAEQSDSTLNPSHSRSQVHSNRGKSTRYRSDHQGSRAGHGRRLSQLFEKPQWRANSVHYGQPPSVLVTNAPTRMSVVPMSHSSADVQSRRPSVYTQPAISIAAPPPTWGCASEKPRKASSAPTFVPPAPFSTVGGDNRESRQSSGSSTWGVMYGKGSKHGSEKASRKCSSRGDDKQGGWTKSTWGVDRKEATDWSGDQAKGWDGYNNAELKNDIWDTAGKGSGDWGDSKDAQDANASAWNTTDKNDGWDQTDTNDVAVSGWNTDNKEGTWGQNDAFTEQQKDTVGFQNDNPWGGTEETNTAWDKPNKIKSDDGFKSDVSDIWAAVAAPVVNKSTNQQPKPPPSKRHTSKSLSKYRQLSSPSTQTAHRQFPPAPPKKTLRPSLSDDASLHSKHTPRVPSVPSEPLYKIPETTARDKGVQHQVLAGPGTAYGHAISRPEYLDSLENPYAVFRFKYRSRDLLRGMFGEGCLSKTGTEVRKDGEEDLKLLSREELVERMVRLQMRVDGEGDGGSQGMGSVARGLTERWVRDHSRAGSDARGESKVVEKVGGWDAAADEFNL